MLLRTLRIFTTQQKLYSKRRFDWLGKRGNMRNQSYDTSNSKNLVKVEQVYYWDNSLLLCTLLVYVMLLCCTVYVFFLMKKLNQLFPAYGKTLQHTLKVQQCELLVWCFKHYGSVHGAEITQQTILSDFEHIGVSERFSWCQDWST